jgi:hypothetical protein
MKKIGILTYHASHNIGSMLQSYSLQTFLEKKYGYEVEFIDYSSPEQRNMYSIFPTINNTKDLIKNIISGMFYRLFKIRYDDFEKFKFTYLKLSEKNYTFANEINELEKKYDYIFLGSDQIWNVNCPDFTNVYFADFKTKATLIAYAPSLGGQNILESGINLKYIKNLVQKIDHLSVREVNGKKWLESLTNRSFEIVADPTLLLEKKSWHSFLEKHDKQPQYDKYIFFYGVPFSKKTYSIVSKISKKLGLKVVMLDAKSWIYNFCFIRGFVLEKHCTPLDYLSLIKNSSLVITTSFHGTIFSTIFEKDFWTVTFKGTNPDDDRVSTLLTQLGLEDRLIYLEDFSTIDFSKKVDYSEYQSNLQPLVTKSIEFIDNSIKEI